MALIARGEQGADALGQGGAGLDGGQLLGLVEEAVQVRDLIVLHGELGREGGDDLGVGVGRGTCRTCISIVKRGDTRTYNVRL